MADRFTYVPLIGIAVIVAWGLADVVAALPRTRALVAGVSVVAVAAKMVPAGK